MAFLALFNLGLAGLSVAADCQRNLRPLHSISYEPHISVSVVQNGLTSPRGIILDPFNSNSTSTTLLVVERGVGVSLLREGTSACQDGWTRDLLINFVDLNHGIELSTSSLIQEPVHLYASTNNSLFRWVYDPVSLSVDTGSREELVNGMVNTLDDHSTRTLLLSPDGQYIYISRGSSGNIDLGSADVESGRAQLRRFKLVSTSDSTDGQVVGNNGTTLDWMQGELVAWGLRNAVGIGFDEGGRLWTVENSADSIRTDMYGEIYFDNPAEELNLIPSLPTGGSLPRSFGYPNCLSYWNLTSSIDKDFSESTAVPSIGTGLSINSSLSDQDCDRLYEPPRLSFQAHSAPLDIKFLGNQRGDLGDGFEGCGNDGGLACEWRRDGFVTLHGSWNREKPTGYSVIRIPWSNDSPSAERESGNGYVPVISSSHLSRCPEGCIRPVGLVFDGRGRLFVTSDWSGEVLSVKGSDSEKGGSISASSVSFPFPRSFAFAFPTRSFTWIHRWSYWEIFSGLALLYD